MPACLRAKRCLFLPIGAVAVAICLGAVVATAGHIDSTPQEVFDSMRSSFQPAKAKGVHARYQWELSGPQGGQWWIDVTTVPTRWEREKSTTQVSRSSPATPIGS